MKSFKKFVFVTLLPIVLIAIFAIVKTQSLEDLRYTHISFYMMGLFSIVSFCYVYIYERLILKRIRILKTYIYSIACVFLTIFTFSFLYNHFLYNKSNYETITFQSTLAVCIFVLTVFVFEIYKKSLQKEAIIINERKSTLVILNLKVFLLISFLLFVMVCGPLLNQFPFTQIMEMLLRIFLFSLQFTIISFATLSGLYAFNYFRKNIAIGVFLASIVSSLLNLLLNVFWGENSFLHFSLFFIISLFCCSIIVTILLYKKRIQNLSFSFSKKETEYLQLKNQINPHFLFNNLNTLIAFIETNPQKAIDFGLHLSNVYRQYLKDQNNDFVKLEDEINFIKEYTAIFKAKFENGFTFEVKNEVTTNQYILSLSLQELIDNIFKHNILDPETPIVIEILIQKSELIIRNTKHNKEALNSTKKGIENINKRYKLLAKKEISITDSNDFFEVKIPILHLSI